MADSGVFAHAQDELQNRLNKIQRERDIIESLLQKWVEKADTVASSVSSIITIGTFVESFLDSFATLDWIYMKLFKVHVLLSEDYFGEQPWGLPKAITFPFPYSITSQVGDAPPQGTNDGSSGLPRSLNVPSLASLSSGGEVLEPHPSGSVSPPPQPATVPAAPPAMIEGPRAQTLPTAEPNGTACANAGALSSISAAALQTVRPLPGGVLSPLPTPLTPERASPVAESVLSDSSATPSDGDTEADQHPAMAAPTCTSPGEPAQPVLHSGSETAPHLMSPPTYTCSRNLTHRRAPATPTTSHEGPTTTARLADMPNDNKMSPPTLTPNGVSAPPPCTETAVGAASTHANVAAPQSVTAAPPASKSASAKARSNTSMKEAADQSDEGWLSEGTAGLRGYLKASQKACPEVSLGREDAKASGDASSSLRVRADETTVGVERPVPSSYCNIPSANPDVLGTTQKVIVSFYKTPSDFWLQLQSSTETLETLRNTLNTRYNACGSQAGFEARVGMFCVAWYVVDSHWYRARIMERMPDHVKVYYVDFGNCDRVQLCYLRPLDESLALLPAQALNCGIHSLAPVGTKGTWPMPAVRQFRHTLCGAQQLEAKFQSRDRLTGRYSVEMLGRTTGSQRTVNLSQEFLSQYVGTPIQAEAPRAAEPQAGAPPADAAPAMAPVANAPPVTAPPPAVASRPEPAALAVASVAAGPRPPTGGPSTRARRASVLLAAAAARQSRKPPLSSFSAAAHPATGLPNVGHPFRIPPAILPDRDIIPLLISVVFNPTDFYVHPQTEEGSNQMLEEIQKQLSHHAVTSSSPPMAEVTKGSCWICLYEGDKNWYRAQVIEVVENRYTHLARVLFVDYGNRSLVPVSSLRSLPTYLAKPPAYAHRMALASVGPRGANGDDRWDDDATKAFINNTGFRNVLVAEKKGQRQSGFETITDVMLWNRSCETPVNINILLVEQGHAMLKPEAEEGWKGRRLR